MTFNPLHLTLASVVRFKMFLYQPASVVGLPDRFSRDDRWVWFQASKKKNCPVNHPHRQLQDKMSKQRLDGWQPLSVSRASLIRQHFHADFCRIHSAQMGLMQFLMPEGDWREGQIKPGDGRKTRENNYKEGCDRQMEPRREDA